MYTLMISQLAYCEGGSIKHLAKHFILYSDAGAVDIMDRHIKLRIVFFDTIGKQIRFNGMREIMAD